MVYYKTLKEHNTVLYLVFQDRNDIRPSNYHREYSPEGLYSLFRFGRSDVISVLKNSIEYSFVFFNWLIECYMKTFFVGITISVHLNNDHCLHV